MAGAGAHLWVAAEEVTAANMNQYLQDQTVMKFATTITRDDAFGGAGEPTLSAGMLCYVTAGNSLFYYDGTAWSALGENDQFTLSSQVFG